MEFFLIVDLYIFKSCEIHYLKKQQKNLINAFCVHHGWCIAKCRGIDQS